MHMWLLITAFGDCSVLLPVFLVTAAWLISRAATRRNGLLWILTVFICIAVVGLSKLMYMSWDIGIPGLDFSGFSGHTALSSLIWPLVPALLIPERNVLLRRTAIALGVLLAVGVAASRLGLGVHSISEVILGGMLGFGFTAGFFFKLRNTTPRNSAPAWQIGISLLLPLLLCYGHTFPSQQLLKHIAISVSGHDTVFNNAPGTHY